MNPLLQLYSPIIVLLTLLVSFSTYVFIQAPRKYLLKWLLIPTSLVVGVFAVFLFSMSAGYAMPTTLPDQFTLLGSHVVVSGKKKDAIEVWGLTDKSRLYRIPYSKQMEQALREAKEKGKGGGRVDLKKQGTEKGENEDQYESNLVLPSDENPKDA